MLQRLRHSVAGLGALTAFDNTAELVLRRLLFRSTGLVTYRKNGMEMVIDHHAGDETGTRECLVSPMYRELLPLLGLKPPLNVFDIGANGGGFPLLLRDEGLPLARVCSVEMNPRTFARMQLNLVENIDAPLTLLNAAICDEDGFMDVSFGRGSTGESIAGTRNATSYGDRRAIRIETLTFDTAFDRAFGAEGIVDLCKIDIEGAEYMIFAGDHHERLKRCRTLLIEIHDVPGKSPAAVVERIRALGFEELDGSRRTHDDVSCYVNSALAG